MASMSLSLPPGFRFHPTDVELVMYYLKRKIMGKKLHFEAIAEVNIHDFSPWDLPDKACLKGKDLEWFFFCPREKKYASGVRVNRATENGYWKITGKDRHVIYNDKNVGTVKTLVFHLGHAPVGKRTDWIIHEYRILDEHLAASGAQDNYVLCKVFKKNGLGPRNGSWAGALFNEADWASDDVSIGQDHAVSSQSNGPSTAGLVLPETQHLSVQPGINDPGSNSAYCPLSPMGLSSQLLVDEPDAEIDCLLAWLVDCNVNDTMLLLNGNGNLEADLIGKGKNIILPGFDGNDINSTTDVQAHCSQINEAGIDFSVMQKGVEFDGIVAPLNFYAAVGGTQHFHTCDGVGSYFNENMQEDNLAGAVHYTCVSQPPLLPEESEIEGFLNVAQMESDNYYHGSNAAYASDISPLPVLPEEPNMEDSFLNVVQMENDNFYHGSNAVYGLDITYGQLENGGLFYQDLERGGYDVNH